MTLKRWVIAVAALIAVFVLVNLAFVMVQPATGG